MGLVEQAIDYEARAQQAYADFQRFSGLAALARAEAGLTERSSSEGDGDWHELCRWCGQACPVGTSGEGGCSAPCGEALAWEAAGRPGLSETPSRGRSGS